MLSIMVRVKEHMQPRHQAAWSATSQPSVTTSGKAMCASTTQSQSRARGPSASVHLPPLTTPRSNLSTHIPLKLQRAPLSAVYTICRPNNVDTVRDNLIQMGPAIRPQRWITEKAKVTHSLKSSGLIWWNCEQATRTVCQNLRHISGVMFMLP